MYELIFKCQSYTQMREIEMVDNYIYRNEMVNANANISNMRFYLKSHEERINQRHKSQ